MQITLPEFMYRVRHFSWTPTQHYFNQLKRAEASGNVGTIENMLEDEAKQVTSSNSIHDPHLLKKIAAECALATIEDTKTQPRDVAVVLAHLAQTEDWLQADLTLFLFAIPFCDVPTLINYSVAILKKTAEYRRTANNGQTVANIQLNILAMLLYHHALAPAQSLINLLEQDPDAMYAAEDFFLLKHLQIVYHHLTSSTFEYHKAYGQLMTVMRFLNVGTIRTDIEHQHRSFSDLDTNKKGKNRSTNQNQS
ncbi:hypothetical protein L248_1105 [Schleiferilactobacillus shenzhenensis LY-73]|uniref:HTH-type transcriptional regulator Rgg C-terminal domain-containing protein n=2 Tax=Schleiferilactobacillus shenzhenensis TaxID=1231337 RepID=U4TVZ2_9LACO|nr:hypothetical protein L248_1105 [Schleiferilactobacillus shenzhenensis LY-73]